MTLNDYMFLAVMFAMAVNASAIYDYFKGTARLTVSGLCVYCAVTSLLSIATAACFWWLR